MTSIAPTTQWDLLHDAARGDTEARIRFHDLYDPFIRRYTTAVARHFGNPAQDYDDLVQDVYMEVFKDGGALRNANADYPAGFRGYLRGLCRNIAFRARDRDPRAEVQPETGALDVADPAARDPVHAVELAYARSVIRETLDGMRHAATRAGDSERLKALEIFRRRIFHDEKPKDIAAALGIAYTEVTEASRVARTWFETALFDKLLAIHRGDERMAKDERDDIRRTLEKR